MNKNILVLVILIVIIVVGLWFYFSTPSASTPVPNENQNIDLTTPINPGQTNNSVKEFTVVGTNFRFSPNNLTVNKGDTVRITFRTDSGMHDWRLDEFNAKTNVLRTAGASETIEFVANRSGEFEYYCSVGEHRTMGMVGKLIVI